MWNFIGLTNSNNFWVEVAAKIKNNVTGEIRNYQTEEILEVGEDFPSTFNWEEGNYRCDCNRELFFRYAANEEVSDEEFDLLPCTKGKYSVNLINPATKECYYAEYKIDEK